jgi:hypothetical protein
MLSESRLMQEPCLTLWSVYQLIPQVCLPINLYICIFKYDRPNSVSASLNETVKRGSSIQCSYIWQSQPNLHGEILIWRCQKKNLYTYNPLCVHVGKTRNCHTMQRNFRGNLLSSPSECQHVACIRPIAFWLDTNCVAFSIYNV